MLVQVCLCCVCKVLYLCKLCMTLHVYTLLLYDGICVLQLCVHVYIMCILSVCRQVYKSMYVYKVVKIDTHVHLGGSAFC